MKELFTVILYIDILLSIASFIFAFILLRRGKNQIYFNFGMAVLCLALWLSGILLLFFRIMPISAIFIDNLTFLFGILILHYFTIFTIKYPIERHNNTLKIVSLYFVTFLVSLTVFLPGLYAVRDDLNFPFLYSYFNPVGLTIFAVYFIILTFLSFTHLIISYNKSSGISRSNLGKIIIGTAVAILFNLIFSILIYYFITFNTSPIGGLSIFAVLFYIYSILYSSKIY